jgi:hypothetical protein
VAVVETQLVALHHLSAHWSRLLVVVTVEVSAEVVQVVQAVVVQVVTVVVLQR